MTVQIYGNTKEHNETEIILQGYIDTSTKFYINVKTNVYQTLLNKEYSSLRLNYISFQNNMFNVKDNYWINITYYNGVITDTHNVIVTPGLYSTVSVFNTWIETAVESFPIPSNYFSISAASPQSWSVAVASAGKWLTVNSMNQELARMVGWNNIPFRLEYNVGSLRSYVMPYNVDLMGLRAMVLCSNIGQELILNNTNVNTIIQSIPFSAQPGENYYWENYNSKRALKILCKLTYNFSVWLTDLDLNPLNLRSSAVISLSLIQ